MGKTRDFQNGKRPRPNLFPCGTEGISFRDSLAIGAAIRGHGTTLGEKRVGVGFNPIGDNTVSQIKRLAADFIDRVNAIGPDAFEDPVRGRAP